jgi:ribonuclease P protein component
MPVVPKVARASQYRVKPDHTGTEPIVPMPSNTFSAGNRLAEHEVRAVLRHGRRAVDKDIELKFMLRAAAEGVNGARLAVAVPKRMLKRAVARNRIKRLIRESFRLHPISKAPQDLLVTYKSTSPARLCAERFALRSRLEALFCAALRRTDAGRATGTIA